jgi:hypothetical protein
MPMILQQVIGGWTARQIHDTVAAIARRPEYAVPLRRSLLGRLLRWILERAADLIALLSGSREARLTVIAAVALIVVASLGRLIVARQVELRRRTGASLRAVGSEHHDYWKLADELATAGNVVAACHAVYLAALQALARSGALTFDSSKTPGDYAREVRQRRPGLAAEFRPFVREFETAVFGPTLPGAAVYAALRQRAERMLVQRAAA